MNLIKLGDAYLRRRLLNTLLNILLLGLGLATITVLLLFNHQFQENLSRNARGIDLVVGAKGSPMQLILSGIYHLDVPTGNIPLTDAAAIVNQRAIKAAIPLSLGDSYRGYRIVGTIPAYADQYEAVPQSGRLWQEESEIVLGARVAAETGLAVGDSLLSTHGLGDGGSAHGEKPLRVAGVLAKTGSVIDGLILTSLETVWHVHAKGEAEHEEDEHDEGNVHPKAPGMPVPHEDDTREITALLLKYSSPIAAVMFPRYINGRTNQQAASPAFETTRLFALLGVGVNAIRAFGLILVFAAALSIFIALYNALRERRYDLAIMRTLGASRSTLLWHVIIEGLMLTVGGAVLGLVLGHIAMEGLGSWFQQAQQMALTGRIWVNEEVWVFAGALLVGVVAALLPAIQAYRTDISEVLAEG